MNIVENLLDNVGIIIVALIGLLIFYFDLRIKRRLQREELKFHREKFEEEREERKERRRWLLRESTRLTDVARQLGGYISGELNRNIDWAVEALERAKLGLQGQSQFRERYGHFREEKEFTAKEFVALLLRRCKTLAEGGNKVYLLIDSGTTLYPFFERLAYEAVRRHADRQRWLDNLVVATNNLPGVQKLMESGRVDPNNRLSPLVVRCHLFPGEALPIYSAVTGEETNYAVDRLREQAGDGQVVFIALVVGNWIRLRHGNPSCPIPLARGPGHLDFKQKLVNNADEIYVVTPLGKVFLGFSTDQINSALGFAAHHADPDRQPYSEVQINPDKARFTRIISTSRSQGRVLSVLSTKLETLLDTKHTDLGRFESADSDSVPHILFPFHQLPDDWYFQRDVEFPHPYTRRDEFMRDYFFVPVDPRRAS